jgi:hypothetical protein
MPFTPFEFAFDRLAYQVSPLLVVTQDGIHTGQRSFWETSWNLFVIDLFSAHAEI